MSPPRSLLCLTPPLLNSASPWASTLSDLRTLYHLPTTGAVTTRTATLAGFAHNDRIHQHAFFSVGAAGRAEAAGECSLNTYGYSPFPLSYYLDAAAEIVRTDESGAALRSKTQKKPFIISITSSSPAELAEMVRMVRARADKDGIELWVELNLSCPNIPGKPPMAYDAAALGEVLEAVLSAAMEDNGTSEVPVGLKIPPFTYQAQFDALLDLIAASAKNGRKLGFITATNTLGGCLVLSPSSSSSSSDSKWHPHLPSATNTGIGGLAGAALHPLALGNVATLNRGLTERGLQRDVLVIGVGGVGDWRAAERMRTVGAGAVAVATALGRAGVGVFAEILEGGKSRGKL